MNSKERRHNFRVKTERAVLCFQLDPGENLGEPIVATTVDLSSRGICLRFDKTSYVGNRIVVQLRFTDPELNIVAPATKVRLGTTEVGYRFDPLTPEARTELTRFVFAEAKRLYETARQAGDTHQAAGKSQIAA